MAAWRGIDRVAAGDLVEGVDREGRGAVRRRQQVGVDAQRRARLKPRGVDRLSTRCAHMICSVVVMPRGAARRRASRSPARAHRRRELAPADREDAAAAADLLFLRRQRHRRRRSCPASRSRARACGSNVNSSPSRASATASGLCTTCRPRLKPLRRKMSPMLWPQTIDHLEAGLFGDALEARRAHLARRADREAIAGDDERLAAMHARAEVRHQVAERAGLPALVERLEALRHAIGRRRDLVGVDRVELLRLRRRSSDPRRSAPAANQPAMRPAAPRQRRCRRQTLERHARLEAGRLDRVHHRPC